jgi:acyl CoA:acetate/3-ketoacid CoA transferase alpha subunit/acyl CoA:acetate/3-ketoacid CoA transferase beta subunit
MPVFASSLEDALAPIVDGCLLVVPREVSGVPMEATRALIRRGVKNLHLVALPTSSLQADLFIGAGCVATLETSAVSLGEFGPAPRFTDAILHRKITMKDATCPALHTALQAAEKGVPFMPLRGIIGSDILAVRPDWKTIDNPYGDDDPIVLLPAIVPDVALIHAPMADRDGNIWIGRQRELATMAHAAKQTIVTVEKITDDNLLADPVLAAGALPGFYIDTIAVGKKAAGRSACRIIIPPILRILRNMRGWPRRRTVLRITCNGMFMYAAPPEAIRDEELLASVIADLIGDVRHVAVGNASPIPATAALLARERGKGRPYVSLLQSRKHNFFTDGARELFDCAGQGLIDVFFLSGGQIDGQGNINLVNIGDYEKPKVRFPGSFGSAHLYYVVPKMILFRMEHSRRTLVEKVDFVSAPGVSPDNVYRTGGPVALVTNRCFFRFDPARKRFRLESVHPGHTVEAVLDNTAFAFDRAETVATTPSPSPATLTLMRETVAPQLAEVYPQFAAQIFGA